MRKGTSVSRRHRSSNTKRVHTVIQAGVVVDREALRSWE